MKKRMLNITVHVFDDLQLVKHEIVGSKFAILTITYVEVGHYRRY
jgi:hypothetical protein